MNSLVQLTIDAHGGLERWRRFEYVTAHLRTGGILWGLKHQQGVLDDVNVRVALRREWTSHSPFLKPNLRTSFEPHRVPSKGRKDVSSKSTSNLATRSGVIESIHRGIRCSLRTSPATRCGPT